MSKLHTRASVAGTTLSGPNTKATNLALWDALRTVGVTDSDRLTVTATATLTTTQCGWLEVDCTSGNVVLTLPTSGTTTDEAEYRIRRIDSTSNSLTVQRGGSDTVEGGTTAVSIGALQQVDFKLPAGTNNWRVAARGGSTQAAARAALGMSGGVVIDRAYAEYTTNADLTATIPADDTAPQATEGTQILSVSLTPKSATSRVRLRFRGEIAASSGVSVGGAIFSSASSSALRAGYVTTAAANNLAPLVLEHEYVPGVTTALTFSVRVGPLSAATVRMNGNTSGRVFGGTMAATLVVEEIAP